MSESDDKSQAQRVRIEVELDDDLAQGAYVNLARVFHTQTEFVMDSLFLPPQAQKAKVRSRVILSPIHAKLLHAALGQNIQLYEQKFGPIAPKSGGNEPGPILH